jgi:glycerophosphoryl diester phosphodiesterase
MRLYLLSIASLFAFLLLGCKDFDQSQLKELQVYGHAGSGFKPEQYNFPGNSLESIKKAILADGADGVEVDAQMSADSVIYLFHDTRLEGNTNGLGLLHETYSHELNDLFYRKSFLGNQNHALLPLSELIDWMNENKVNRGLSINIQKQIVDSFQSRFNHTAIDRILAQTKRLATLSNIYIESPSTSQLDYLVSLNPQEYVMWDADLSKRNVELAVLRQYDGIVSEYTKTDKAAVDEAKVQGIVTVLFGLRIYPDIREAFALGPDIVQTDNVALTRSLRDD